MAKKALPFSFRRRAEMLATAERTELGLTPTCRLDPRLLAERHGIRVVELSALPGVTEEERALLMKRDSKDLSALLVGEKGQAVMIVNDAHTPARQANSMCHEVAHLLLGHSAGPIVDEAGVRVYPERQEDEANWLAGALLVPVKGLRMLHPKNTRPQIEENFGVSAELLRWRCNKHGMASKAA
jgi:Zn-dependent peptidase ImmA (M78 family)